MMNRALLFLLLLWAPVLGSAQVIDMMTLPSDFSFVSQSERGLTTVTYVGRDGDLWLLESHHPTQKDKYVTDRIWTNRESQLVRRDTVNGIRSFEPHDCAPGQGDCTYTLYWEDGRVDQVYRTSYLYGDIEISEEYLILDGEEVFWYRDCTTFDQWGFWIDYVRYDFEGNAQTGQRIQSSHEPQPHTPFEQLKKLCADPPDLVS